MGAIVKETIHKESLSELGEAIQSSHYVRAVKIAESIGKPADEIKELQRRAIKEFIVEYRNPHGAIALAEEYHFSKEDMKRLLQEILQDAEEKKILEKRQYDIKTMRYLTLKEWIKEYFKL